MQGRVSTGDGGGGGGRRGLDAAEEDVWAAGGSSRSGLRVAREVMWAALAAQPGSQQGGDAGGVLVRQPSVGPQALTVICCKEVY